MQYVILSNNSTLADMVCGIPVEHVDSGLPEFHAALSNALLNNHKLVSAPLPPNVPLIRSPVRSVILQKSDRKYDAQGLIALEKAMERSKALGLNEDDRVRKDLEFIDKDHLLHALEQLREMEQGNI